MVDVEEFFSQRVEVFEHHPVLDDNMSLVHFIVWIRIVGVHRSSVDAAVDL